MGSTVWKAESGGCETCRGHQGVIPRGTPVPDRPHDHCRCTKVTHHGNGGRNCLREFNIVAELRDTGWDYSPATGLAEVITIEFDADVICRNGAELTVSFALRYDGSDLDELQGMSDMNYEAAIANVYADAEDKALEEAAAECPGCETPSPAYS